MNKLNILLILSLVVLGTIFINRKLNLENFANNKYSYLGCYKDGPSRDFKFGPKKYGYNKDSCSKACKKYNYFALQAGSWCSCDNVAPNYRKVPNKECGRKGLGAGWKNSVYKHVPYKHVPYTLNSDVSYDSNKKTITPSCKHKKWVKDINIEPSYFRLVYYIKFAD